MSILIYPHPKVDFLVEFLEFNSYGYHAVDLWQPDLDHNGRHTIPDSLMCQQGSVVVVALDVLADLVNWSPSLVRLQRFLQHNHMIAVRDGDSWIPVTHGLESQAGIHQLDHVIPPGHLEIITDGTLLENHWLRQCQHVRVYNIPTITPLVKIDRIRGARTDKLASSRDYLLTTVIKPSAPHREILWNKLSADPALVDRGIVIIHNDTIEPQAYVGYKDKQTGYSHGMPSMDLYRNAWIELVPETLCNKMHYITEKTTKPMATRTPFLMLSTPGYLAYLRHLGFHTFNDLIDESYDHLVDLHSRATRVIQVLSDVVRNGTQAFYQAAQPQLIHNQQRLAEIMGSWYYDMDQFLLERLDPWIAPVVDQ